MANVISSVAAVCRVVREELRRDGPLFGAMGTTGEEGEAHVRMVVVRGFDAEHQTVWVTSHSHAQKVEHLRNHPVAEVAIWLPERKMQIRLKATWRVIDGAMVARMPGLAELRRAGWREISAVTRLMFVYPPPLQKLDAKGLRKLKKEVAGTREVELGEPPACFAMIVGTVEQMDVLRLTKPVHERWLHVRGRKGWESGRVTA